MGPDDLLRLTVELCDHLGVTYLVTGSTATIAYGEPRFTNDIDIVIDLPFEQVNAFCDAFPPEEFYVNRETVLSAVRSGFRFRTED